MTDKQKLKRRQDAIDYGPHHRRLRRKWARLVKMGLVSCSRCGEPILPDEPFDLGHDDEDRTKYVGPEHQACNRATAGRRKPERKTSREW